MSGYYSLFFKNLTVYCSFNFLGTEFISRVVDTQVGIKYAAAYEKQIEGEAPTSRNSFNRVEGNAALYILRE